MRRAVLLAAVAASLLAVPGLADADRPGPCWKMLVNDWYDGRIEHSYPAWCYRSALRHAPADGVYSSLREDLGRELAAVRGGQVPEGGRGRHGAARDLCGRSPISRLPPLCVPPGDFSPHGSSGAPASAVRDAASPARSGRAVWRPLVDAITIAALVVLAAAALRRRRPRRA